jgi:hypothetical protein
VPRLTVATFRLPSKKVTFRTPRVEPAVTNSGSARATQARGCGSSQVTVGRLTARRRSERKTLFGRMSPAWSMFFDSW